jgi:hypothetical protein
MEMYLSKVTCDPIPGKGSGCRPRLACLKSFYYNAAHHERRGSDPDRETY